MLKHIKPIKHISVLICFIFDTNTQNRTAGNEQDVNF